MRRIDVGSCVEGCLVRATVYSQPILFMVKGYEHPEEGLVVEPYRLLEGRRLSTWNIPFLEPLVRTIPCIPRPAPIIEYKSIDLAYFPDETLKSRYNELPNEIKELLSRIDYEWIGLTGSWAAGLEGPSSDVDLLVYGRDVYASLIEALTVLGWGPCAPRPDRVGNESTHLSLLYNLKHVEACKGAHRVTIRILRELESRPCTSRRAPLGLFEGEICLYDIGESYLVPARYRITWPQGSGILETWRTRYQELPSGKYNVRGELWIDGDTLYVSPDIGGQLQLKAWEPCS
jgi:hypothetical protein